jgi:Skp family chaperone for outer membrane proteins
MNRFFIALLLLSLISCGTNSDNEKKKDVVKQVNVVSKDTSGLVIAYYHYDSIKVQFEYYKNIEAKLAKRQSAYQNQIAAKTRKYENYIAKKGKEAQEGLLSENEIMQVQQKVQQMEAEIGQYQQTQGIKLEQDMIKQSQEINNKVESFGKKFSELNGIDVLFGYSSGGQINYINSQMDVTKTFIEFLNAEQAKIEKDL